MRRPLLPHGWMLAVFLALVLGTPLLADSDRAARAIERAQQTGPIRDLYAVYPATVPDAAFHADRGRWVVRFRVDAHRWAGLVELEEDGETLVDALLSPMFEAEIYGWRLGLVEHGLLAALVLLAVYGPWRGRWVAHPADLALLFALVVPLHVPLVDNRVALTGLWLITLGLMVRAWWAARLRAAPVGPPPALGEGPLVALLVLAVAYHGWLIATGATEDSGIWGCFGAQHLMNHGEWPYGLEHFGEGAAYGPLLYVILLPLVWWFPPGYQGPEGWVPLVEYVPPTFERLSFTASKLLVAGADLALLGLLAAIGARRDRRSGLALALTYAILPYTALELIHPSRSVPTAFCLAAYLWVRRPAVAGAMLGCGIAALHYPVALVPLWWRQYDAAERRRFVAPLIAIAALCLMAIHWGDSDFGKFYASTWEYQEGETQVKHYGKSPFGFWGQTPELAALKPVLRAAHLAFCALLALWPRPAGPYRLAALTAAILTGIQLWKSHGGGGYICWHLPFVLIALLGRSAPADPPPRSCEA